MEASLEPIQEVLGRPGARFYVPVFQRSYAWGAAQCDRLYDDALRAGREGGAHFLGTLIYLPEKEDGSGIEPVSLIDGQQRMATLTLLLAALRDRLVVEGGAAAQEAARIESEYLRASDGRAKLVLSPADAPTLEALTAPPGEGVLPDEPSRFLVENHARFSERMRSEDFDAGTLLRGSRSLQVVGVRLGPRDAAQQVFESLNAKGRPLTTADLLRNTLLMAYGSDEQERLLDRYWRPIEEAFGRFAPDQDLYIDAALHRWLVGAAPEVRAGKRGELYGAFKSYLAKAKAREVSLEDVLRSLNDSCLAFASAPGSSENKAHLDWAVGKTKGLISQRKLFGD